jgi:predicted DsbA family dithiol-disulfide isomerase
MVSLALGVRGMSDAATQAARCTSVTSIPRHPRAVHSADSRHAVPLRRRSRVDVPRGAHCARAVKITYYLEVTSSWCFWSEPTWAELKRRYEGRVEFGWKIAKMTPSDWPVSREQCDWFYRRSGTIMQSPFMLNSAWFDPIYATGKEYPAASYVAEAAKDFGFTGDEIRLALSDASEREGIKTGRMDVAVDVAVKAGGKKLNAKKLRAAAESKAIAARIEASTKEFFAHQITQRPAYVLEDSIGDKAVFSGLVKIEPLAATIDAMLADTAAYASYKVHFGGPPAI